MKHDESGTLTARFIEDAPVYVDENCRRRTVPAAGCQYEGENRVSFAR
ncbi:MAG: hypothetical protein VX589_16995 [Myxococcota bacterium]|nr:hypothetical protein [Myxococcota bacterium]